MNDPGQKILAECVERYTTLHSYQDHGVVRTWFMPKAEPHELNFSTWFMKPNFFRFEFTSPHPFPPLRHIVTKHICGFDGTHAYSVMQLPEETATIKMEKTFELAVAGATGISGGSVHTIARLLFPSARGFSLNKLTDVKLIQEVEIENILCYELTGVNKKGAQRVLWIGKSDLLLRKFSERVVEFPSEEIRSAIVIDADLGSGIFTAPQP